MSSAMYSWNDANCFPVYVAKVDGSELSVSARTASILSIKN